MQHSNSPQPGIIQAFRHSWGFYVLGPSVYTCYILIHCFISVPILTYKGIQPFHCYAYIQREKNEWEELNNFPLIKAWMHHYWPNKQGLKFTCTVLTNTMEDPTPSRVSAPTMQNITWNFMVWKQFSSFKESGNQKSEEKVLGQGQWRPRLPHAHWAWDSSRSQRSRGERECQMILGIEKTKTAAGEKCQRTPYPLSKEEEKNVKSLLGGSSVPRTYYFWVTHSINRDLETEAQTVSWVSSPQGAEQDSERSPMFWDSLSKETGMFWNDGDGGIQ